jgi:hypothetical protein
MTTYINELLQERFDSKENYMVLAETINNYITSNNESKYNYIIDAMQVAILQYTDNLLLFQECEELYLAIKGFESLF